MKVFPSTSRFVCVCSRETKPFPLWDCSLFAFRTSRKVVWKLEDPAVLAREKQQREQEQVKRQNESNPPLHL